MIRPLNENKRTRVGTLGLRAETEAKAHLRYASLAQAFSCMGLL